MYQLKTEADFDSAHFLSGYTGKCSNIHGHRWHVEIEIESRNLEKNGQERGTRDGRFAGLGCGRRLRISA